jgi:hypothetical protein
VGNPHGRIALRHIMPNVLPPLIVRVNLSIASAGIAKASLSSLCWADSPRCPAGVVFSNCQKPHGQRVVDGSVARCFDLFVGAFFYPSWGTACEMRRTPRQK